ncbi:MAG: hemerythrin domain-containing protein [Betaproteobacteria bacterium]|nr:hemerythrin domain-containing protein [Betaproteobacteria bacterium]
MNWKDEFATGIHNIDDQHETILESITRFERNSEEGTASEAMRPLLLRTRELVVLHFKVEESLMQLLAYSDLRAHRAEHKCILDHIADLEGQVLRNDVQDKLAPLVRHLLFGHVADSDKRFAQYALDLFSGPSLGVRRTAD